MSSQLTDGLSKLANEGLNFDGLDTGTSTAAGGLGIPPNNIFDTLDTAGDSDIFTAKKLTPGAALEAGAGAVGAGVEADDDGAQARPANNAANAIEGGNADGVAVGDCGGGSSGGDADGGSSAEEDDDSGIPPPPELPRGGGGSPAGSSQRSRSPSQQGSPRSLGGSPDLGRLTKQVTEAQNETPLDLGLHRGCESALASPCNTTRRCHCCRTVVTNSNLPMATWGIHPALSHMRFQTAVLKHKYATCNALPLVKVMAVLTRDKPRCQVSLRKRRELQASGAVVTSFDCSISHKSPSFSGRFEVNGK